MKGYDLYSCSLDVYDLLEYITQNNISIYHLNKKDKYYFLSTLKYRKILNQHPNIQYEYSIGGIGMLFRFVLSKEKMIAAVCSSILFVGLTNTIFSIEVLGDSKRHKEMIIENLKQFQVPFLYYDTSSVYKKIMELNDDLNWYEVIRKGSNLEIYYLPRNLEEVDKGHKYDLIASKEGVIARFDVSKGNKMVNINEKVRKGDLLVSHITLDSQSIEKTSDVIGKVYAYTFKSVDVEIEKKDYPIGVAYYLCLLKSRMMIDLDEDESIVNEISLHFSEDFDTIRMSNYYVLYEMISIVGE